MGLIRWIKGKYYDSRLKKADSLVLQQRFVEAEEIYRSLFGKQPMSVVHLANRYVLYSDNVEDKLSALKTIIELQPVTDEDNRHLYNEKLLAHVGKMSDMASSKYCNKQYHEAVLLVDAIAPHKKEDTTFSQRVHQYHAYLSFSKLAETSKYEDLLNDVVHHLQAYSPSCKSDIKVFYDALCEKCLYTRAIKLLSPFISIDSSYKTFIAKCCEEVICKNDKDVKRPTKLSKFCFGDQLCHEAATHLFNAAVEAFNKKDYAKAVLYDEFASEFLASDNNFCVRWCNHIFMELAPRANVEEVKSLLAQIKKLKLSDQQVDGFKRNIARLAQKTSPEKAIAICQLFLNDKDFESIYISQAESLAKTNAKGIDKKELLNIVRNNTTEDSFVDVIAPFVPYITDYVSVFMPAAIAKIKRHKSTDFLKKYWSVREDAQFFKELITPSSEIKDAVVDCIVSNNKKFLPRIALLSKFQESIDALKDVDYAYTVAEKLYKNGSDVLDYFLKTTNTRCDNVPNDGAITIIDHTLEAISYKSLTKASWVPTYLRKRKIQENDKLPLSQRTAFYKESIDFIIDSFIDFNEISEPSFFTLWQDYATLILKKASSQPKDIAIKDLANTRVLVENYCKAYATYTTLCDNLTQRIAKYRWEIGNEQEEDHEFDKAISTYRDTINENVSAYSKKAEYRFLICKVKLGQITEDVEQDIDYMLQQKANQSLHNDLAYRYACYLIKAIRPNDAERIVQDYIPGETQLAAICTNLYIKESEKYLQEFNDKFALIEDGKLSLEEASDFYKRFDHYKQVISRNLTDTTNKFVTYRRKLENYIIKAYFDKEMYADAFEKLPRIYPNFFEDDTNFRNVAIAALGTVESDEPIGDELCKKAISVWLSAIYNDRLFVKSLDYTSWDDQYTFTLEESLGGTSDYDYENLPDNINFDEPVENENISIAAVQNSLISRMEMFVRDDRPSLETFFNTEKDALDAMIELRLDEKCIVAAPFFAKQTKHILESIKDSFDTELTHGYGNEEDVLALGVQYGFTDGEFGKYKEAKGWADLYKSAANQNVRELHQRLANLPQIKAFSKLYDSVKSFFSNKMSESIKDKMNYRKFIDTYEQICLAFNDTPLSMAFSQYANGEVVHLLNDDSMSLRDGIGYMVRIYKVAPSSIQVKKNLEGMLCNLAASCAEKPNSSDEQVLNKALRDTGSTFRSAVDDARVQGALSAIVDKVNNNRMTKRKAFDEVYSLYQKVPNNDRLCENLVTLSGLCISEYIIGQKTGASSVKRTLDNLNNNKSDTFKRHAKKLLDDYNNIMSQLPYQTRSLLGEDDDSPISLLMRINSNTTLNSNGLALKEGLGYFKKLGGYVRPRRSSPFGIDYPF